MMNLKRRKLIAANWKMNLVASEVRDYINTLSIEISELEGVDILLIPPFTALPKASKILEKKFGIKLGAQNMHFANSGAFTGEISPAMLRDLFVRYVLIGHSERRLLFGETDTTIAKKIAAAHHHSILPILCIGESLKERQAHHEKKVLAKQLQQAFKGIEQKYIQETIIAYEPVWAIGTGETATMPQIIEAHQFIRSVIEELSDSTSAQKTRIIYGGSVKASNAKEILNSSEIDGALVGGASLDPRDFAKIALGAAITK